MTTRFYRQSIPDIGLSIERATDSVPDDGKFYVIIEGETLGSFRALKPAQQLFRQTVAEIGYRPPEPQGPPKTVSEIMTERYMEAKDLYWSDSHRYRPSGGKGR